MGMETIQMSSDFNGSFLKRSVSLRSGFSFHDGIGCGFADQSLRSDFLRLVRSKSIPLEGGAKVKSVQPVVKGASQMKPFLPDIVLVAKTEQVGEKIPPTTPREKHCKCTPQMKPLPPDIVLVEKTEQVREKMPPTTPREKHCVAPPYGMLCVIGSRQEMEDTAVAVPDFYKGDSSVSSSSLHFFGVYDGHGGSQVSRFCRERLHEALAEQIRALQPSRSEDLRRDPSEWETAVKKCFRQVDIEVGGLCPTGKCSYRDGEYCAICECGEKVAPDYVGSAAVVAVVSKSQIVVGNCGDSRAILCRAGKAIPLSDDHKANRPDEIERIEAAGGQVVYWKGYRVGGVIAVSRAIGDRFMKDYVISEPEVICSERTDEDEFVILASDGIWDVLSNEYACQVVGKCLDGYRPRRFKGSNRVSPAVVAASLLTKMAIEHGSTDNISVVVIDLQNYKTRRNQNIQ